MNYYSPTTADLRKEADIDRRMAANVAAWTAYRELVRRFLADFNRLEWPVVFPSKHFDQLHIPGLLNDTLIEMPADRIREIAEEQQ